MGRAIQRLAPAIQRVRYRPPGDVDIRQIVPGLKPFGRQGDAALQVSGRLDDIAASLQACAP
jgi:hypothetical protein